MVDFSEYCDICDLFGSVDGNNQFSTRTSSFDLHRLSLCAAVNDICDDSTYIELLVKQCNLETLIELLPYFEDDQYISDIIQDRIAIFQNNNASSLLYQSDVPSYSTNFYCYLSNWIEKKGFSSEPDFYKSAGISRQVFSKLRSSNGIIPREMALHLSVGLGLNYDECVEFMKYLGYSLNQNSKREQIIIYVIRKREYSLEEMDQLLLAFHEKTFLDWS